MVGKWGVAVDDDKVDKDMRREIHFDGELGMLVDTEGEGTRWVSRGSMAVVGRHWERHL